MSPRADASALGLPRLLGRALVVSYRARGRASCALSAAGFALALLPTLTSATLRSLTDAVQALYATGSGLDAAVGLLALLVALYLARQGYDCLRAYYAEADTERIMASIRETILRTTCTVRLRYLEGSEDFAERISFVDTYAGEATARSLQSLAAWLQNLVAFTALALIVGSVSPWVVVAIVVTCAPGVAVTFRQQRELYDHNRRWSRSRAFAQLYYQDCTRFQSLQEVRFQRILPYLKRRKWRAEVDGLVGADNALRRRHALENAAVDLAKGSVYLVILLVVAAALYRDPALGLGAFTMTLSAAGQMQSLAAELFLGATQLAASIPYLRDYFALEDLEPDLPPKEAGRADEAGRHDAAGEGQPAGPGAAVTFDDVTFAYPGSEAPALREVSITIPAGQKVAIVGRNGSGKSTFVSLLCGLYAPQEGTVRVGGMDASDDPAAARAQISAVFQDFGRYEDTLRFNVTVSDEERPRDDDAIRALAAFVGAEGLVDGRPGGLDAVVGSYSEAGNNLSGGQWQRVALMRAAWRDRARVMVLDEPTSALDPLAEALLYRRFAELVGGRTALLISHRLGVAAVVDRILVFDGGRIVEDGTHDELLAAGGLYAELYEAQAQWYR